MGVYYRFYVTLSPAMLFRTQVEKNKEKVYVKPAHVMSGWAYFARKEKGREERGGQMAESSRKVNILLLSLAAVVGVLLHRVVRCCVV